MGHCRKLTALLLASGLMSAAVAADSQSDKLQGTWIATSAINDGKKVEEPTLGEFVFSGDTFVMKGKRTLRGKFKVDSSKTPKHIELNFNGENGSVVPSKAIYKIDGNTLTLCEADVSKPRPSEFTSVAGSKESLIVLVKAENIPSATALAEQPREKPKELDVLGQYVGDWTSDVTSKPAVWTPEEKQFRTSNHAEFILDDWFLQHIEVNHVVGDPEKVTKALMISTYDSPSKKYVTWFFQSSGVIGTWTGKWDAKGKALTLTDIDLPPNTTAKLTEAFPDDGTINGTLSYTDNDGLKMFDMVWTRNRQAGVGGKPTCEQWAEIGTPIKPIPDEVKMLKPFIGEWDSEFIQRPSVVSPSGNTSKGTMTAQWILDGRFLLGTSEVGNHTSKWIIGYDTNKEAYRYIRFTNTGQIDESTGQWNEDTRSFVWKLVNAPSGVTRTSTTRIVGEDGVHAHILAENSDGKVQMDLTIRSTRRK